jgi:hypothetical protein
VGAHHDHVGLAAGGSGQDLRRRLADLPLAAVDDLVAVQETADRVQHLGRLLLVVAGDGGGAHHAAHPRRHLGLRVDHEDLVFGAAERLVGDQEGQGFLGVLAAVGGQDDAHGRGSLLCWISDGR